MVGSSEEVIGSSVVVVVEVVVVPPQIDSHSESVANLPHSVIPNRSTHVGVPSPNSVES